MPLRWTSSTSTACVRRGPGLRSRSRGHDGVRDRDRLSASAGVDRRAPPGSARAGDRHQRLDEADAFLFDALVVSGDSVIVERPTYDRTLLSLRNRGADVRMVELEPDGIDVAAVERVLAGGAKPSWPTSSRTSRTLPATRSRPRSGAAARTRPPPRLHDLRGRPLRGAPLRGIPAAHDASTGGDSVVYASSFSKTVCPGIRWATWSVPPS